MAKLLSGTRIYGTATVDTTLFVDGTDDASSATTGAVQVVGGVGIGGTLYVEGTTVFAGDLAVNGGDLTTTATTFNLINANATTVNFAGAATILEIGAATGTTNINNNLDVDGDVNIDGGDLTVSTVTFNLANTTATAVNFAGAATSIEIGSATGVTNINNNLDVDGDVNIDGGDLTVSTATFNLANGVATTVNAFGAGTAITIGDVTGTTTIRNANTVVTGDLAINGGDITSSAVTFNILPTTSTTVNAFGAASALNLGATNGTTIVRNNFEVDLNTVLNGTLTVDLNATVTGDLAVNGGDITTSAATFNLINANATTVNFAGAATSIEIGAATGTTNINNNLDVDGDVNIDGGDLTVSTSTFNLANTTATTGNLFGAATTVNIGAAGSAGILTVRNDNVVLNGDLAVNGGDLTTTATTFNLITANATTVNAFTAATTLEIGAATGTTNINNNLDVDGDVNIDGGDLTVSTATFNLANTTATTVNAFGAATTILIGAGTGTTEVNNNLQVDLDLDVRGGDITTNQTTFNLINTTATTGNLFGDGTAITIGAVTGTTTIRNANTVVTGDLAVNGADITTTATGTATVFDTNATAVNAFGAATSISIGAATGTTTINNANTVVTGDLAVNGSDITTTATGTATVFNTNATAVNAFGAATSISIGAATGTTTINNTNTVVTGDLAVNGADITTSSTGTATVFNTNATTVNAFGAATTILIGAVTGTTEVNNNLQVDLDLDVRGGDITTNQTTFNLINTNATTGNLFGDGTAITIGAVTGTTTIRNANTVVTGDLAVNGADITTTATGTATVFNTNATTVNFAGAGTTVSIGAATGTTTINNANTVVTGDLAVNGGDLTTGAATFNLINATATTVNFAGAATSIEIGAATGTTNINNNLDVDGDVNIDGGDLTVSTSTFNLANTTATTVNFAGAATSIEIGAATGTTNINNNLDVDGDVNIDGGDLTVSTTTFNLANTTATTGNLFGVATGVNVGINAAATSTLTFGPAITGNTFKIGSTAGGTINLTTDVTGGIANLFGSVSGTTNLANAGTINLGKSNSLTTAIVVGGAITGNSVKIASTSAGTVTLNSDVTTGTVNLFNNVTTGTLNVAAAGSSTINLGNATSTVNVGELTLVTDLEVQYGGTGVSTFTTNGILFGNAADPISVTAASNPGSNATTSFGILTTDINNVPVWTDVIDGGSY